MADFHLRRCPSPNQARAVADWLSSQGLRPFFLVDRCARPLHGSFPQDRVQHDLVEPVRSWHRLRQCPASPAYSEPLRGRNMGEPRHVCLDCSRPAADSAARILVLHGAVPRKAVSARGSMLECASLPCSSAR